MEKKNVIITIAGLTGSSTHNITYLLKKFLRENNIETEIDFGSNVDFETEREFDHAITRNFDDKIKIMQNERKITLQIKQLQCNSFKYIDEVEKIK